MTAANRAYYAIFHCVRAVMALDRVDRKRHSGVLSYFQQHYIKTGIFEKEYSNILVGAFEVRQDADYEDFYILSKSDAIKQVENAERFYKRVSKYIKDSI